jgi:V8-like Glu-specific endopeptidase
MMKSRRLGRLSFLLIAVLGGTMPVYATPTPAPRHTKPVPPIEQPRYAVSPTGERVAIPDSLLTAQHHVDVQGQRMWVVPGQPPRSTPTPSAQHGEQPADEAIDNVGIERVIEPEERAKVNTTTTHPSSAVVEIRYRQNGMSRVCTGWLYDDNYVATAGHCILSRDGFWSTNIISIPDGMGTPFPMGRVAV